MSTVLITGAGGEVARGVLPYFPKRDHELRLLDIVSAGNDSRRIHADLFDWNALVGAMTGVDAVLHLAVASGHSGHYEHDEFNDRRFDINVKGTWRVFESARRAGARRVVHVSSLMTVWGHGAEKLVPGDAPARPVGTYALTKALGEEIARHYAIAHGINVVVIRMAAPLDVEGKDLRGKRVRPQQVPFPDLAQAFWLALTAPLSGVHVVTIVGESSRRMWDLEPARRLLGYTPRYRLDDLGVEFADPFEV